MKKALLAAACVFLAGSQAALADGGKLVFSGTDHAAEREAVLKANTFLGKSVSEGLVKESSVGIALADLNGDGKPEIFVYAESSMTCGSAGCTFTAYQKQGSKLKLLLNINTYKDVAISSHATNGMNDIILHDGAGRAIAWHFDGTAYSSQ